MGYPNPAADYVENRLSLDDRLIHKPAATYYMKASETIYRCGIMKDALLVLYMSATPCDGSIVVCAYEGELVLRRLKLISRRCLQDIDHPNFTWPLPVEDDDTKQVYGVVTYVINDARGGEFDDSPVM
ncbi:LexA family transcriptional regulator [Cronobacter sakazakii]|uniref:HumD family translesion DNA polymerase n=1 Tax=Enterobacteriaceae TaxID=543 RepID=UPI000BE8A876|nr:MULTISPECIES: S24 family peptidase [Enterobacteriaceae]AXX02800.1 DNA polymerase V [Cronobacter sakazakii]ELY2489707.1 LexA family transcriptional regulator [Cronobacter sakazakii]ELY2533422.1 LexA family transcriptional regulator [Cronobacter sakazakii]ELY2538290.1 LexA family transcriptional regulator [Cronobacter sakazakii]ELY2626125.1 LexA family transcriptional regulator [Cronobacter sakazakii]